MPGIRRRTTDGTITLRATEPDDIPELIAGRDAEWERWLGPDPDEPRPAACIIAGEEVVGWVDYDTDQHLWPVPSVPRSQTGT